MVRDHPRPSVTADVVALRGDAPDILLIRRKDDPHAGRLALPGGFCGPEESLEQAAARELREETGATAGGLTLVGVYSQPGRDPRGWVISTCYLTEVENPEEVASADDAAEVRWMSLCELLETLRAGGDRPTLAFDHDAIVLDAGRVLGLTGR